MAQSNGLKGGITLSEGQAAFVRALRKRLPEDIGIYVTSAGRGPQAQASAMLNKFKTAGGGAAGAKVLYDLYAADDVIKELVAAPETLEAWTSVIARAGTRVSKHMTSSALDLRSREWTPVQRDAVIAAVRALGGRTIYEGDHLHVDVPAEYAARSGSSVRSVVSTKPRALPTPETWVPSRKTLVLLGAAGSLSLLLIAMRRRMAQSSTTG